jgi:alpha-galactosidase
MLLGVGDDGRLHQLGFGPAVPSGLPTWLHPLAYPTFGEEVLREPALRITHADGATSTRLVFRTHDHSAHAGGAEHRVTLEDRVAPVSVTLGLRTWPEHDLLEQWVEVTNEGTAACTLHQAASASPALSGPAPHLTHWGGGWANEWQQTTELLSMGTKSVASAGGVRPSLHRPPVVLLSPDGPPAESAGPVVAVTVAWGGDVRFDAEVGPHHALRLIAGTEHRGAERTLEPGDTFVTPSALLCWSELGVGPTSRSLHRYARSQVVRDGGGTRATVVNTWEAVGFSLDPAGLGAQVDAAADLGAELFLLDDGWFGTTHPRDDDTVGLGDWDVDRRKLPDGLQPLIDHTLDRGLRFGLWVEPEMVNPGSALYEAHPDWVIAEPDRARREERNQLVLDVCRPEVAAFCVDVIDRVLTDHPGVTYLKWDANRDITEPGSGAIPADRQAHLPVDRVRATWGVMAEVARRHPDVELMLCASGGGRSDLGTLRWFHELWTSDNTDPIDRVRIQWGASHLLPASVTAAHVTRWGQKPFAFACAVAMTGRFGFDVDLRSLADDERATAADAVTTYHRIRDLVQHGDLHRLVSPIGRDVAALAFVAPGGDRAAVFAHRLDEGAVVGREAPLIEVAGIGIDATYEVVDLTPGRAADAREPTIVCSGAELASGALGWPVGAGPCSNVWELRRSR